jgi:hypothetical protein
MVDLLRVLNCRGTLHHNEVRTAQRITQKYSRGFLLT